MKECDRDAITSILNLELQKELELAITTNEIAVIDNVGPHGRFKLWRSILREWYEEKHTTRAQDPSATTGVAINFSPMLNDEKKIMKSLIYREFLEKAPYSKSYFGEFKGISENGSLEVPY